MHSGSFDGALGGRGRGGSSAFAVPEPAPPGFDVVDPDGRRITVHPHSVDDRVADLLRAIGAPLRSGLAIDGAVLPEHRRLVDAPQVRHGARLELSAAAPSRIDRRDPSVRRVHVAVTSGPACTPWIGLAPGRHRIGRAVGCAVEIEGAEPYHGVLDVAVDGSITFTQLTGRIHVRVDGEPAHPQHRMGDGTRLTIGPSVVTVRSGVVPPAERPPGTIAAAPDDTSRLVVHRAPALDPVEEPDPLVPPQPQPSHPMPPATGLIGAAVGIGGALGIAILLGQPMFALFALIGGVASFSTWVGGVFVARRHRRAARRRADDDHDRFAAAVREAGEVAERRHRRRYPSVSATLGEHERPLAVGAVSPVWSVRVRRTDPLEAVVGDGELNRCVAVEGDGRAALPVGLQLLVDRASRLRSAPIPVAFAPCTATALQASRDVALGIARSIVVQLATWSGPADWRLVVVTGDPGRWRWCEWLPHMRDDLGQPVAVLGPDHLDDRPHPIAQDGTDEPQTLVVVDSVPRLGSRVAALRRLLDARGAAALVLVEGGETVPSICDSVLTVGDTGSAHWSGSGGPGDATGIAIAGVDEAVADRIARSLSPLVDPEVRSDGGGELPSDLRIADLTPDVGEPAAIARRWRAAGSDPRPAAPIGRGCDGAIEIDLVRDGPHGLIAGTTGAGKSELLRTLVVGLAARLSPDHLTFVLVDYKGGSTFDACVDLPHTVGLVTDLDGGLAERALVSLEAELAWRERLLREVAAADLTDYRAMSGRPPLPRIVVVVDEFAALARELPGFLGSLIGVAQRGRSLGVHLLLATQRPAGVVGDDIRANTNLRLALRLHDTADAIDVVGDDLPARFPRDRPGRVAMRLGPDELVMFQSARCTAAERPGRRRLWTEPYHPRPALADRGAGSLGPPNPAHGDAPRRPHTSELDRIVTAVREAASLTGTARPRRPWHDPLPESIERRELDVLLGSGAAGSGSGDMCLAGTVGVVDDPEAQCRHPLRWRDGSGNLALIGSLGSGTTTALVGVAIAACRSTSPERCHLYAIDGGGEPTLDALDPLPHCGAVIRVQERERLARLLARLTGELDARTADAGGERPRIVLLVDRLGTLRSALGTLDEALQLAQLDRLLADGPGVGICTAFTLDGSSNTALTAPAGERWLFHIDDPAVARGLGAGRPVDDDVPGRMRIASSGLAAQVVAPEPLGAVEPPGREPGAAAGPEPVGVLPKLVATDLLGSTLGTEPGVKRDAEPCAAPADDGLSVLSLAVGLASDDLCPAHLRLPAGEHVFIGGLARTGRSTALARVAAAWSAQVPDGRVVAASRVDGLPWDLLRGETADAVRILVALDDAERFDDREGWLREVVAGEHPNVTIAVAAGLDAVRSGYGHWTREVARSRCGLILTAASEIDGDLLGVTLPRRSLVPARPGLGWLVDGSGHRLVQVALDESPSRRCRATLE